MRGGGWGGSRDVEDAEERQELRRHVSFLPLLDFDVDTSMGMTSVNSHLILGTNFPSCTSTVSVVPGKKKKLTPAYTLLSLQYIRNQRYF